MQNWINKHYTSFSKPAKILVRKNIKPDPKLTPLHCHSQHKELDLWIRRRYQVAVDQPEHTEHQQKDNSQSEPSWRVELEIQREPTLNPAITPGKSVRRCCFSQIKFKRNSHNSLNIIFTFIELGCHLTTHTVTITEHSLVTVRSPFLTDRLITHPAASSRSEVFDLHFSVSEYWSRPLPNPLVRLSWNFSQCLQPPLRDQFHFLHCCIPFSPLRLGWDK